MDVSHSDFERTPITYLKGVGPQKAEWLTAELGIQTFGDLLNHIPNKYMDRTVIKSIRELEPEMGNVQVKGELLDVELIGKNKGRRLKARLCDDTGCIELVWFQSIPWIRKILKPGEVYIAFGKISEFKGIYSMSHPELQVYTPELVQKADSYTPIYPLTEKLRSTKIDSKIIAQWVKTIFEHPQFSLPEFLPGEILSKLKIIDRHTAYKAVHFPKELPHAEKALNRFKFEEIFLFQMRNEKIKIEHKKNSPGPVINKPGFFFNEFYHKHLPFELTEAQQRVIKEIWRDLKSGVQMNRLLQGDVGSGKTVVAFITILLTIDNGYQTCLMAPTEILAQQHFESLKEWANPIGLKVALLTGSSSKKERRLLAHDLENGLLNVLVGTHALLEDSVKFKNLGYVIVDEQHRFGVAQRARMWLKAEPSPHMLVMTATPIPRTLAMTAHGELEHSVIDQMPAGRKLVKTIHKEEKDRYGLMQFIKTEIEKGRQVYFVFPLIEESETIELKNLMDGYDTVTYYFPVPQFQIGIVHGKMKPDDKEKEMERFKSHRSDILVATTVIEVGVNVPNASVMVIESAERFGLSQLHQLRGRVGRGAEQSYCILITKEKLSQTAKERVKALVKFNDGFEIAKIDLKQRGPGDLLGTKQSGLPDFKFFDVITDEYWLQMAKYAASHLLNTDPELILPSQSGLKKYLQLRTKDNFWSRIA